ncbi:glycosyltransferase family 2 protein [Acinetobacter lwoffii]|uniref:glycosyltransferase family 2 protein n=1 Tax=Acinetobacter lwoffii TaxID=28090 RepID=UPI002DB82BAE|nr:glycosyltransferase family 2 protein [Acinetobacter lwoffii]MEB6680152.1 glycosyltransferase family 2 protein [Acinetobacter lwoffii]
MISIGIPIYNAENYLTDAVKSVLAQTYPYWELILVDDGSTDNSLKIAQDFAAKDNRIRVISDGTNKKLPARLNQIIREAKYDYIARMDADDVMHPQRLEKQFSFLEDNIKYDLVSSGLISIDSQNIVKGFRCVSQLYDNFSNPSYSYPIVHPSVMARKSWYLRNQYSEKYPRAEDFELWTRAIANKDFNMMVLSDLLLYYREEGNLSIEKIINSFKDMQKIYSKYDSKNILKIDVLKLNLKILATKFFYFTGNLQKLASRRNKKLDDVDLEYYQKLLNKIVSDKAL